MNAVTLETKGLSPALLAKLDPHLIWALISDFKDYRSAIGGRFDLMAELQAHKSAADVQALLTPLNANIAAQMVTAYALHAPINFVSLSVNRKEFLALLADPMVQRLQLATSLIAPRSAPRAAPQINAAKPSKPIASPADTLLAVIDDGCPFAHQMFTRHGRYRLRALWDQDRHPDFGPIGCVVKDFSYGAVADQAALQKHIRAHTVAGVVNEQACYQALGYQSALRAYSHGAHSLGMLLDGPRLGPGAQPTFSDVHAQSQFDLVFVQLPRDVIAVPTHGSRLRAILDGVRWLITQASPSETNINVLIPYGSALGPHDGSAVFTQALDALVIQCRDKLGKTLNIMFAAGNEHATPLHWQSAALKTGQQTEFTVRLRPASELPVFLEIWLPDSDPGAEIDLLDPNGRLVFSGVPTVPQGVTVNRQAIGRAWPSIERASCSLISNGWTAPVSRLALVQWSPTAIHSTDRASLPGDWTVRLRASKTMTSPIHAYLSLSRGGTGSLRRAGQSRLLRLKANASGSVTPAGALSDACTGTHTTVIGAYKTAGSTSTRLAAKYSSAGPARGGSRALGNALRYPGPDYSMPGEESASLGGFRNAGNRSASGTRMNGTSVAVSYFAALKSSNLPIPSPTPPLGAGSETQLGTSLP